MRPIIEHDEETIVADITLCAPRPVADTIEDFDEPTNPSNRTAVMHVMHVSRPVSSASRGWELESVPGCAITTTSPSPREARVSWWAVALTLSCGVLVSIVAAVTSMRVEPRRQTHGTVSAATQKKPMNVTPIVGSTEAAPSPVAEAPTRPQPALLPRPVKAKPRTVSRPPSVKAPALKKLQTEEDDETTKALETLRKVQLENASAFGE